MKRLRPAVTHRALVGQVLARLRRSKGLSQGEVAASIGMSQSLVSRYERGHGSIRLEQIYHYATILVLPLSDVMRRIEQVYWHILKRGVVVLDDGEEARPNVGVLSTAALGDLVVSAFTAELRL